MLLALLALGLMGLIADRALMGGKMGPRRAGAAELDTSFYGIADKPGEALKGSGPGGTAKLTLADRLDTLRREEHLASQKVQDAFCPSQKWLDQLKPEAPSTSDQVRAQEFIRNHTLKATVVFTGGGAAIIDEKYLLIGQELDGFRLVSISRESADFVCDEDRVTLTMSREQ